MATRFIEWTMRRRAARVLERLLPVLPDRGTVLDVGSGTGHNAEALRQVRAGVRVIETDVTPMALGTRRQPLLIVDGRLPLADHEADVAILIYVLHHCSDTTPLLQELRRVTTRRVVLLQTTASDTLSRLLWRGRDTLLGQIPYKFCQCVGLIGPWACPMATMTPRTRSQVIALFEEAGWHLRRCVPSRWIGTTLSRDLFVFERDGTAVESGKETHVT